jgi:hypothetical protein
VVLYFSVCKLKNDQCDLSSKPLMAGTDPLIGRSWAGGRWLIWPADEVRVDQLLVIEAET